MVSADRRWVRAQDSDSEEPCARLLSSFAGARLRQAPEPIEDIHPRYVSVEKSESHSATTQSLRPSSKESNALRTSHVRASSSSIEINPKYRSC